MKVVASLWFESPGAYTENRDYPSIAEVVKDMADMRDTWNRLGGGKPCGVIYHPDNLDYPIYTLELTDRGRILQVRT